MNLRYASLLHHHYLEMGHFVVRLNNANLLKNLQGYLNHSLNLSKMFYLDNL